MIKKIKKSYLFFFKILNNFLAQKKKLFWQQGYFSTNIILILIIIALSIAIIFFLFREPEVEKDVPIKPSIELTVNNKKVLEIAKEESIKLQWTGALVDQCVIFWEGMVFKNLEAIGEKEIVGYLIADVYDITIMCKVLESGEKKALFDEVKITILGPETPVGWIKIPESIVEGERVESFLVMKYEAKEFEGKAISKPDGIPWVNIDQGDAVHKCYGIGGRLISDIQWIAIANNIAVVGENWTGGEKGLGKLSQGHSGRHPNRSLSSIDIDEADKQKRTFKLSNNKIIWDFAGNVQEWTINSIGRRRMEEDIVALFTGWIEYNDEDFFVELLRIEHIRLPKERWSSQEGIGKLYVPEDIISRGYGFVRGGAWNFEEKAGIFALNLGYSVEYSSRKIGFRCIKPLP